MASSFPQPESKEYDTTADIVASLRVHDALGCEIDCGHIGVLQSLYGVIPVALAIDKFNYEKGQK